ncbi:hypothetical protein [Acidisoma silvae]|uniref:Uncharacterized protein n=1 Tax=Acidisoma silvae TaxID=2802396 RepID=A0A963YVY3_9PROT|nr:hypothetical protein [Acidisoma silvae]MCB8878113.1 hypothetical protein [Acidisoma silvae]
MSYRKPTEIISETDEGQITKIETMPYLSRSLADFGIEGVWLEVDAETAEQMGAFDEIAVTLADTEDDHGN